MACLSCALCGGVRCVVACVLLWVRPRYVGGACALDCSLLLRVLAVLGARSRVLRDCVSECVCRMCGRVRGCWVGCSRSRVFLIACVRVCSCLLGIVCCVVWFLEGGVRSYACVRDYARGCAHLGGFGVCGEYAVGWVVVLVWYYGGLQFGTRVVVAVVLRVGVAVGRFSRDRSWPCGPGCCGLAFVFCRFGWRWGRRGLRTGIAVVYGVRVSVVECSVRGCGPPWYVWGS